MGKIRNRKRIPDTVERFLARCVRAENGCLLYAGPAKTKKTLRIAVNGHRIVASHAVWSLYNGPLDSHTYVYRSCENIWCFEKDHLYIKTLKDRLYENAVYKENGCIEYGKRKDKRKGKEYGKISLNKHKTEIASRTAYRLAYGDIPEGLVVCHKCDYPPCINPEHLFLGTSKDNSQDAVQKGRMAGINSGTTNHSCKLTEEQVLEIRSRSSEPYQLLAKEFHISRSSICLIIKRKNWKYL